MYIDIDRTIETLKGCTNETDRQIAAWLEELKTLRLNSCMIHLPERLQLVENGYNKAIDDFAKEVKNLIVDLSVIKFKNIDEIAEQLKAGVNNGTDNQ